VKVALPVSVQIITLNEEANIGRCIECVAVGGPAEIVVIDGGSTDRTVQIARELGARVLTPGRLGRGASRHLGYHSTSMPYVAMVDADDRIGHDWLETMIAQLEAGQYAALQGGLRVQSPRTFWERGWNDYFIESIRPSKDTIMVGHPAVYRTEALQGARNDIGHENEDTQLSVDFVQRGLRQGIASAFSFRVVPDERHENVMKWRGYGRGYRAFTTKHPERRRAIMKHMLVTIPFVRGFRPLVRGRVEQPFFAAAMAASIIQGYLSAAKARS
jgi:glycosyltransferase involved in cell wall biosynthesis